MDGDQKFWISLNSLGLIVVIVLALLINRGCELDAALKTKCIEMSGTPVSIGNTSSCISISIRQ